MVTQLKGKDRAVDVGGASDDDTELKQNIVRALIAMVEIWMDPSYDLWYVPHQRQRAARSTVTS